MKKQTTTNIKDQKAKIENRLLTVFATALGAEMIALYLFNWFQTGSNLLAAAKWATYILMLVFLALGIFTIVKGSALKKAEETVRSKKYMNWFYVCLAGLLCCLYIWPVEILANVFGVNPSALIAFNNFHPFLTNSGVQFRIAIVMILIAIYIVAAFIYYGIKSAELNKTQK